MPRNQTKTISAKQGSVATSTSLNSVLIDTREQTQSQPRVLRSPGTQPQTVPEILRDAEDGNWLVHAKRNDRYDCGRGTFVVTFIEIYQLCIDRRIRGEARTVVDWLCLNVTTDNLISGVSRKKIAEDAGIAPQNVSAAFARLESEDIMLRGGPGEIFLNPRYFFIGPPPRQHRAAKRWDERHSEYRRRQIALAAAGAKTTTQASATSATASTTGIAKAS